MNEKQISDLETWFAQVVGKRVFLGEWYYIASYNRIRTGVYCQTDVGNKLFSWEDLAKMKSYYDSHANNVKMVTVAEKTKENPTAIIIDATQLEEFNKKLTVDDDEIEFVFSARMGCFSPYFSNKPLLRIEGERGTFVLAQNAADIMGIGNEGCLQFGFKKSTKQVFVKPHHEGFKIKRKDKTLFRFTSKGLKNKFLEFFNLENEGSYFTIKPSDSIKGMFDVEPTEFVRG